MELRSYTTADRLLRAEHCVGAMQRSQQLGVCTSFAHIKKRAGTGYVAVAEHIFRFLNHLSSSSYKIKTYEYDYGVSDNAALRAKNPSLPLF